MTAPQTPGDYVAKAWENFVSAIQEHMDADAVQAIWTAVLDDGTTRMYHVGHGNAYARQGMVEEWASEIRDNDEEEPQS